MQITSANKPIPAQTKISLPEKITVPRTLQKGRRSDIHTLLAEPQDLLTNLEFVATQLTAFSLSKGDLVTQIPHLTPVSVMTLTHAPYSGTPYTIIIDPGHGGSDPGTIGAEGLLEKELTLDIANRIKDLLMPHPHLRVRLTRDTDRGFSRAGRVRAIDAAKADLLISLHFNNLPQSDLTVVEAYYAAKENILESELMQYLSQGTHAIKTRNSHSMDYSFTQQSKVIAEILQQNIYQQVKQQNPNAIDAGIKNETLYTLTQSRIPATLIELTCLSNAQEEQHLKSSQYRHKIAASIAEGTIEYFATLPLDRGI